MCLILEDGTSATCLRCASSVGVGLARTMGPADRNCLVGMTIWCYIWTPPCEMEPPVFRAGATVLKGAGRGRALVSDLV
jgi:hypothetical protein